ncbi:MAG: primosomal protein N', partial [Muribaculaceae bacterium]|nr:primosomal protein N' [Muribaculaceae bacterium]
MSDPFKTTDSTIESRNNYVEVVVPLPLDVTFTYRVPPHLRGSLQTGSRVIVPFGLKKFYTAIVVGVPNLPPEGFDVKDVAMVLDPYPVLRHPQLKLWRWIADYYLCAIGDVYKAALPGGLKIESETFVENNPDYDFDEEPLADEREAAVFQLLDHSGALTVKVIESKLSESGLTPVINSMIDRGVLIISEKLVERYRVKHEDYVAVNAASAEEIPALFSLVKGARKQEAVLLAMLELSGFQRGEHREVSRKMLLERSGATQPIFSALVKKGVLKVYKKEINRFSFNGKVSGKLPRLSGHQADALDLIHKSWLEKDVVLLHGVTSSGKTEIYIHLINFVLSRGDQALFLVPEIALTTQLTRRLQMVFGEKVVIYHSKFSDNERVDIWKKLLHSQDPVVVIGARSALFLPFSRLGVVIVDEEHESSYKQVDPAPRYNARDVAVVLAAMHGAKTLLGSATPAVETYYKALNGKFGLVTLTERYGDVRLPEIRTVDMKQAARNGGHEGAFSAETLRLAREAISNGSQVIFFQNRRGYAPLARCRQCAWSPRCEHCDVALTYHSHLHQLQCHYCGAVYPLPSVCPQCKEPAIEILGYGTERIGEEAEEAFKGERILRMDL